MSKYEKRNVKKIKTEKPNMKASKPKRSTEKIKMRPVEPIKMPKKERLKKNSQNTDTRQKRAPQRLSVIMGRKDAKRGKFLAGLALLAAVIILFVAIGLSTPTGIPETISNSVAVLQSGDGFPQTLSGEEMVFGTTDNNVTYALSTAYLETFNSSGANLINDQHGFSNAVLKTSSARALLFDRGGIGCKVYNHSEAIFEESFEDKIVSADISRNGSMAFALNSKEYSSRVEVYNKDFDRKYTWNCANELVSAVALSESGSKLAVATFTSKNGSYCSTIYVFEYDSATPVYKKEINGDIVISLYSDSRSIWAVTRDSICRVSWKDYSVQENEYHADINLVSHSDSYFAVAVPSEKNSLLSKIELFSKKGEKAFSVVINGEADKLCVGKKNVYVLVNETVFVYNLKGENVSTIDVGYGVKYIAESKSGTLCTIGSKKISSYKF